MIKGTGIDLVSVEGTRRLMETTGGSYERYTYTDAELEAAGSSACREEFLAARFAAKEAVFKAVSPLLGKNGPDMRSIEILNRDDGSPYVNIRGELKEALELARITDIHLSITTEGGFAAAFAVAEQIP